MDARDPALEARLKEQFRGCCFGGAIHAYAVCDSTMERAHALAREGGRRSSDRRHSLASGDRAGSVAGEGTLVFAARQTQGRGRMGRRWESPDGGAYFSLILRPSRPPTEIPQLSLVAGLAAAETIQEQLARQRGLARSPFAAPLRRPQRGRRSLGAPASLVPPAAGHHARSASARAAHGQSRHPLPVPTVSTISIRWPNDVLIDGKKVAGILTEARDGAVVLGIGINVTTDPKNLPETATSLEKMVPGSERTRGAWHLFSLVAAVCSKFDGWYDIWTAQGFAPIRAALLPWLNLGSLVRLTAGSSQLEGQAIDVDEQGRLVVRLESGVMRVFEAGEVSLLR